MYDYRAPIKDIKFVYHDVLNVTAAYSNLPPFKEVSADLFDSIVEEAAKFAEGELTPLNRNGDEEGAIWDNGIVRTPKGFKQAWEAYREAGWQATDYTEEEGGQKLPDSIRVVLNEILNSANKSWTTYVGFGGAASKSLRAFATKELRDLVIPKYASGEVLGTMCLTEPHCGTDLGLLKTKATPNDDGTYSVTGTKIFITAGDHDFTDNIVHLVLARISGAPSGVKGISLFVIPKLHLEGPDEGRPNGVSCGSVEHKMGIKGSATCVINFDEARAYLVGEPNRGLPAMFPMMNTARIGVGVEGVCHAEVGLQKSLGYALDRVQMRALANRPDPDAAADPIIVHPDVRRMLMFQKVIAEGGRLFAAYCAQLVDIIAGSDDEKRRQEAETELSFLTPTLKAFCTELGFEAASLGMQCFGGHGYVREWGAEQNVRDARISMLYEGTNGIQALDLLGRKMLGSMGKLAEPTLSKIAAFCSENKEHELAAQIPPLLDKLGTLLATVAGKAADNPDEVGAASTDFLMITGYVLLAYFWARAAVCAEAKMDEDPLFYGAKLKSANFYFEKVLPRIHGHEATLLTGADTLMAMTEEEFCAGA